MYWGIDGCQKGWIAIGLSDNAEYQFDVFSSLRAFWIAIDAPAAKPTGLAKRISKNREQNK